MAAVRLDLAGIAGACAVVAVAGSAAMEVEPAGAPSRPAAPASRVVDPPLVTQAQPTPDATLPPPSAKWTETHPGLETADTLDCLGCHGDRMRTHSHPVDVDYAEASNRGGGSLRPIDEVRARGVELPAGKVGCRTCHAPASPWARFLAVPRELAQARPTIAELRASEPAGLARGKAGATPPKDGAEVSSRPLCEACHLKS